MTQRRILNNGFATAVIVVAMLQPAAPPQPRERLISGTPQCPRCTLTAKHVVTLSSASDSVLLYHWPTRPGVTHDGKYLADGIGLSGILVFEASGKLSKVVGRAGQGPNEFPEDPKWTFNARGDTMYVISRGRAYVLDAGLREVRRMPVTLAPHYTVLGDGSIVVMSDNPSRDSSLRVSVVAANGTRSAAFVIREPFLRPDPCAVCRFVSFAAADRPSEFWVLHTDEFVLRRWTSAGRLVEVLRVQSPPWRERWLDAMRTGWLRPGNRMPSLEVSRRSDGLLLVTGFGPTAAKKPASSPPVPAGRSVAAMAMAMEPELDQVFDIVDPARGVLASTRVQQRRFQLMQDGRHVMRVIETPDGIMQMEIWELIFSRG